jgi:hypothetical protein
MTTRDSVVRRCVLVVLVSAAIALTPGISYAKTAGPEAPEKEDQNEPISPKDTSPASVAAADDSSTTEKAAGGHDKAGGAAANEKKGSALTVVVLGNGKPIAQAEVKIKFPSSVGGDTTRPTNDAGKAVFNLPVTGAAKVRVIATGWTGVLQEALLEEGAQTLTIDLVALPTTTAPTSPRELGGPPN